MGKIWNKSHPGETPIALLRALAQCAVGAPLDSIKLHDPARLLKLLQALRFLEKVLGLAISIKDKALIDRTKTTTFESIE
ncbi:hypothetical protein [Janthinobacterium sp. MDT1-19]|uniref:hypothetical protein n=1 Tax=Janthinobacterium sp. MDT1-19 TaxID=1259339 RepID=UPI003F215816